MHRYRNCKFWDVMSRFKGVVFPKFICLDLGIWHELALPFETLQLDQAKEKLNMILRRFPLRTDVTQIILLTVLAIEVQICMPNSST